MGGAGGAAYRDGELTIEEGDNGSVSGVEEVGRIEETRGEGEEVDNREPNGGDKERP